MSVHTWRAVIPAGTDTVFSTGSSAAPIKLFADDGRLDTAIIVDEVVILPHMGVPGQDGVWTEIPSITDIVVVTLSTEESGAHVRANVGDNRQIGWWLASEAEHTSTIGYLDPEHLAVHDLWIGAYAYDSSAADPSKELPADVQVIVRGRRVSISEDQGVLAIIKAGAQNV